jgi:hypothetical protein
MVRAIVTATSLAFCSFPILVKDKSTFKLNNFACANHIVYSIANGSVDNQKIKLLMLFGIKRAIGIFLRLWKKHKIYDDK